MPGRSSNSANPNDNYKFTGHERDDEAGLTLDYMGARYYDPVIGRFLQVDPLAEKFPGSSPYTYTLNNPIRLVDPDGRAPVDPFLITVRTYIPYRSVAGFHGDNRSASTATNASYRTSHTVGVETNPNVSRNPQTSNDGGKTGLTSTVAGPPPSYTPLFGKASEGAEGGFQATVTRSDANGGDNAIINFSGSSNNPFSPTDKTSIDYNFSISITPGKDGSDPTIAITGSHDGFPAFEINVTNEKTGTVYQVYSKGPDSKIDIRKLLPPNDDQKIDQ